MFKYFQIRFMYELLEEGLKQLGTDHVKYQQTNAYTITSNSVT